jgi:predicted HicB family RNase H-like nuclease
MKEVAIIVRIPEELRKQIKVFAAENNLSMKGLIVKAVRKFMNER